MPARHPVNRPPQQCCFRPGPRRETLAPTARAGVVGALLATLLAAAALGGPLGLAVIAATAAPASAHAILQEAAPADGSALDDPPAQVTFRFSEAILADDLAVDVVVSNGHPVVPRSTAVDPADATRVVITLDPLARGTYQIRLTARDREDLHQVVARTSFAVGEAPPPPSPPVVAAPEPVETAARWLFAAGLVALAGALTLRGAGAGPGARSPILTRMAQWGAGAAVAGRFGVQAARVVTFDGNRLTALRAVAVLDDTRRLAVVIGAAALVLAGERHRSAALARGLGADHPLVRRSWLGWLGLGSLCWVAGFGGHSLLGAGPEVVLATVKAAHLAGLALWLGPLAAVLVAVRGPGRGPAALRAVQPVALGGAALTVVSGLLLASHLVVSATAALSTPYGQSLVVKLALGVGAAVLGLAAARGRRLRWATAEAGVLGLVVLAGAAMATATPALDPGFLRAGRTPLAPPATPADDLLVQLRAIPGRPGDNTIELRVASTRRPDPGPISEVRLTIGGTEVTAVPDADGLALITGVRLAEGDTPVAVLARRPTWTDTTAELTLTASTPRYTFPVRVSSAPLRWPLTAVAGFGAAAAVTVGVGFRRRQHGTGRPAQPAPCTAEPGEAEPWLVVPEDTGLVGEVREAGGLRAVALAHVAGGDVVEVLDGPPQGHGLGVDRGL